jgi:ABC-type transport system involved in multi-copper enzyme maturation permease subunit
VAVTDTRRLPRWLFPHRLDEALAMREWRRSRRWLQTSSVPTFYVIGTILLPWVVVPALYASFRTWTGQVTLQDQPRWMYLSLALTLVGGAMAAAFTRVSQIWQTERRQKRLEGWFLSRQEPRPLVVTAALAGVALALVVSVPGVLLLLWTALWQRVTAAGLLLTLLLLPAGSALTAAAASAVFFVTTVAGNRPGRRRRPKQEASPTNSGDHFITSLPHHLITLALVALLALGLWLRIESVEHGWTRPWEEHPGRLLLAAGLLTPVPSILGFASRRWWVYRVVGRLDFRLTPEQAALVLLILYALTTLLLIHWSVAAYRLLRSEPERDRRAAPAAASEGEITQAGAHGYWAGFGNPVWTRELRTRLRGRKAPQFIFLATVALAVGGFTPLVTAAGQLGDPLATVAVAQDVFCWLAMTLTALIILVAPSLTAEAIGAERARGTLELLLATPLSRAEILRGMLLGDLSVLALLVGPSLPLFGFCYLFHGAEGWQVIGVFVVLGITALLCALLGVTASPVHTRTLQAKWQAYRLLLFFCGLIGGPVWLIASPRAINLLPSIFIVLIMAVPIVVLILLLPFVLEALWRRACKHLDYLDEGETE